MKNILIYNLNQSDAPCFTGHAKYTIIGIG